MFLEKKYYTSNVGLLTFIFESDAQDLGHFHHLKAIYHPLYGMNNYVLIWSDWLSCDPLRGSHNS